MDHKVSKREILELLHDLELRIEALEEDIDLLIDDELLEDEMELSAEEGLDA